MDGKSGSPAPVDGISEYEKQRLQNIERNAAYLSSLGMDVVKSEISTSVAESKRRKTVARGIKASKRTKEQLPRRKSARLTGQKPEMAPVYNLDALFSGSNQSQVTVEERVRRFDSDPIPLENLNASPESDAKMIEILKDTVVKQEPKKKKAKVGRTFTQIKEYTEMVNSLKLDQEDIAKVVKDRATALAFHPSDSKLIVGAADKFGKVGVWLVDHRTEETEGWNDGVFLYKPHCANVGKLQFHPRDYAKMYTTSYDGTIRCLDLEKEVFEEVYAVNDEDADLHYSYIPETTDSSVMYIGDTGGVVKALDMRTNQVAWSYTLHERKINTVQTNPSSPEYLVSASLDRTVAIWDIRQLGSSKKSSKPKSIASTQGFSRSVNCAYFSYTGNYLITVSQDDKNHLFENPINAAKGKLVPKLTVRHNNNTGRWLTKFHPTWDVKGPDVYVIGSMEQPRRVEVFSAESQRPIAYLRNEEFMGSVQSLNIPHTKLNIFATVNSSGKVHIYR